MHFNRILAWSLSTVFDTKKKRTNEGGEKNTFSYTILCGVSGFPHVRSFNQNKFATLHAIEIAFSYYYDMQTVIIESNGTGQNPYVNEQK